MFSRLGWQENQFAASSFRNRLAVLWPESNPGPLSKFASAETSGPLSPAYQRVSWHSCKEKASSKTIPYQVTEREKEREKLKIAQRRRKKIATLNQEARVRFLRLCWGRCRHYRQWRHRRWWRHSDVYDVSASGDSVQILSLEVSGKWVASGCLVASGHPVENRPCLEKKRAILHQGMEVGGSAKLGWVRKVKGSNPAAGIGHSSLEISDN